MLGLSETDLVDEVPGREGKRLWALLNSTRSHQGKYRTTTHMPTESLKTCVITLCLGVTINTTSSYVNTAVWHFSVHSLRYDLAFAILCHHQSTLKRSINVVDLEWLCLHLFCPANWPLIAFLQFHSAQLNLWKHVSSHYVQESFVIVSQQYSTSTRLT